jgi:hypothetical protein
VAGDKGQWGFVLQGMRPAAAQAAEWCGKGQFLSFPHFLFLKERGRRKGLGIGAQFDPLAASDWQAAVHVLRWGSPFSQ